MKKDIAIIGGGIGGCLAAYTAAKLGKKVLLTEETEWIGGQLTSQAIPPDEHKWIEQFGSTKTYRKYRKEVRDYYKKYYPLKKEHIDDDLLNPGNAWVSRVAHEPRVSLHVINSFLQPFIANGRIEILLQHKVSRATVKNDEIKEVFITDIQNGEEKSVIAKYYLDATELGDVLPLAKVDYIVGAESKHDTKEVHALEVANPQDMQSFTHVFALDYIEGGDFTIEKPALFDQWNNYQAPFLNHKQLSYSIPDPHTGESIKLPLFADGSSLGMWEYRRIIDANQFEDGFFDGDISLINWPQNDYWSGSLIDVTAKEKEKSLYEAKQLSLSLLYWLQTEAPRKGNKKGYPGLRLRPDVVGTKDGLAMHPYIRESRRIKAVETVTESAINASIRGDLGIKKRDNSVGIGAYRIDLHPTTINNRMFYAESYPFEIPLGSLIPIKTKNLIPACKNIGTTQLTNGCFRVQHSEWNIGESAGALASFAVDHNMGLQEIYNNPIQVKGFQKNLENLGIALHWPEIKAF